MREEAIEIYLKGSPQASRMVDIIHELIAGERQKDIARRYSVGRSTIAQAKQRYLK